MKLKNRWSVWGPLFALVWGGWIVDVRAMDVEVVQSVPVETTLKVTGIRETAEVWMSLISGATKSIDLEQFYINNQSGQSLDPVIQALIAAAGRGVQVRLIVDRKFMSNYPEVPNQLAKIRNIAVKIVDYSRFGGVQHAKFMVVDGVHSFVGSANFDWLALSHIHEVGLRIADANIASGLKAVFEQDWGIASPSAPLQALNPSSPGIGMMASPDRHLPAGVPPSLNGMVGMIAAAKTSLKIQVYQYSLKGNWTVLDQELRKAAARGVQVRLMIDAVALKNSSQELNALASVKNIEVKSITIPKWSGGVIPYSRLVHSKYFTVDGKSAWVGTENWSEGYFGGCRNVGVLIQDVAVTSQLDQIHDRVWTSAYARSLAR
jgi:phosphatidylserine/phosphatidylglycerophosphate/cardiolipin synthase-like enzyme